MLDYSEGANHCLTNSSRLETSARIILNDDNGTDSFGLFLYYIAYEEIAKAIFCLFVERGWIKEEFVDKIFRDHRVKIFLFDEIFRSFEVNGGRGYLGGKPLGDISLNDFTKTYESIIKDHREKTTDFLYVDKNDSWHIPLVTYPDVDKEEEKIRLKIEALNIIFEFLTKNYDKGTSFVNNFRIIEDKNGRFSVYYDSA